ncbi:MAG: hypothetical protein ABS75_16780 [Pelagibacterium sp. SCN 63-23]|nr:MAG: hypothetical protein ABS75_16780 [Pelagibacterium sp. SCN 63-23]
MVRGDAGIGVDIELDDLEAGAISSTRASIMGDMALQGRHNPPKNPPEPARRRPEPPGRKLPPSR